MALGVSGIFNVCQARFKQSRKRSPSSVGDCTKSSNTFSDQREYFLRLKKVLDSTSYYKIVLDIGHYFLIVGSKISER
jgi:hypothetical protein